MSLLSLSITAIIVSVISLVLTFHVNRLTSLSSIINVELSLSKIKSAFRFHGITDKKLEAAGITAEELAYLVSSFTAGGIYHRISGIPYIWLSTPFKEGTYRYEMCKSSDTRKAWPLIKKMMNPSRFRDRIDNTIKKFEDKEIGRTQGNV